MNETAVNLTAVCADDGESVFNQVVAWLLLVGILLSYVPQLVKVLRTGTAGLALGYVALTAFAGLFLLNGEFFAAAAEDTFLCCRRVWSLNECADKLLPIAHFASAFVGQAAVFVVFLVRQSEGSARLARGGNPDRVRHRP